MKPPVAAKAAAEAAENVPHANPIQTRRVTSGDDIVRVAAGGDGLGRRRGYGGGSTRRRDGLVPWPPDWGSAPRAASAQALDALELGALSHQPWLCRYPIAFNASIAATRTFMLRSCRL